MKIKWIVCMGLVLIAVCLGVSFNYAHGISNFKCTNQSRYRITRNSVVYDFYVKQTIQLYEDNTGFISFNGKVVGGDVTQSVSRKILLRDGHQIDNHTLQYQNDGVRRLPADHVEDDIFQILLAEVSGDDATLIFERERIDNHAWLIGNPNAWVLTCVEY